MGRRARLVALAARPDWRRLAAHQLDAETLAEVLAARGHTRGGGETPSLARNGSACPAGVLAVLLDEVAALVSASCDGYTDDIFSAELDDFAARAVDPDLSPEDRARFRDQASEAREPVGSTPALRASLRATATAIHEQPGASVELAARVAEHLRVDPLLKARELASSWLALHDAGDRIKRPELVRAHILAGSPGDLSADALFVF